MKYAIRWSDATEVSLIISFTIGVIILLEQCYRLAVIAAHHLAGSTKTPTRALMEPEGRSRASSAQQACTSHPKQRHMHAERLLCLWKLEHQLQTQKETEKLWAAKKHQSQVKTTQGTQSWKKSSKEASVPMCWAQPGLNAAGKDTNQGHQQAAIPGLAEEQDSGFATKKKFKATFDSVTIFPSYGNNLSWRFIFSRTFASRRIKTGRALISVSFMLLPVYSFSKEVTFYLPSVGIKAEAQKKIKIS